MNTTAKSKVFAHINKNTQHTLIFRWAWSPCYKVQMLNMLWKSKRPHPMASHKNKEGLIKGFNCQDPFMTRWQGLFRGGWKWGGSLKFSWYVVTRGNAQDAQGNQSPHSNCVAQILKIRAYNQGCANIRRSEAATVSCKCHAECSWDPMHFDRWRKKTKKRKRTH